MKEEPKNLEDYCFLGTTPRLMRINNNKQPTGNHINLDVFMNEMTIPWDCNQRISQALT